MKYYKSTWINEYFALKWKYVYTAQKRKHVHKQFCVCEDNTLLPSGHNNNIECKIEQFKKNPNWKTEEISKEEFFIYCI